MVANAKNGPHPVSHWPSALQGQLLWHADFVESPMLNVSDRRYWASVTDEFLRCTWGSPP
jgi:hypothetical protein